MNCINAAYVPLNPAEYGWKWDSSLSNWEPVWYEGNPLPDYADIHNTEEQEFEETDNGQIQVQDSDDDDDGDDESDCVSSGGESSDEDDGE